MARRKLIDELRGLYNPDLSAEGQETTDEEEWVDALIRGLPARLRQAASCREQSLLVVAEFVQNEGSSPKKNNLLPERRRVIDWLTIQGLSYYFSPPPKDATLPQSEWWGLMVHGWGKQPKKN